MNSGELMKHKIVAIGIDAPNSSEIKAWLKQGELPNIRAIFDEGANGDIFHVKRYRNERCWDIFLFGRDIGSCGSTFLPESYDYFNESLQREDRYKPFYALGNQYDVCMFDLPATVDRGINGIQISGWGSELNAATPLSQPPELIAQLRNRHGSDPKLSESIRILDHQTNELEYSYVLPSLYDQEAVLSFKSKLITAVERRTDICLDLLSRGDWDLFLALYVESHTMNHVGWHLGGEHPLAAFGDQDGNAQLEVLHAIDHAIGEIAKALPDHATLMVYTIDNTGLNSMDIPSMALLPELLFRWNYPSLQALGKGDLGHSVPAMRTSYDRHWKKEVWSLTTGEGKRLLASPYRLEQEGHPMSWNPAAWYQPLWASMKAFALPSVADGYVRLNVQGREANGIVSPDNFVLELAKISELLERTIDPRSRQPLVKQLIATRDKPGDSPEVPPDLIVCWNNKLAADVMDSPDCGRIGPLPYFRSGGHLSHGSSVENFFAVRGPGIHPGVRVKPGNLEDLPATILDLLGAKASKDMTGSPLIRRDKTA